MDKKYIEREVERKSKDLVNLSYVMIFFIFLTGIPLLVLFLLNPTDTSDDGIIAKVLLFAGLLVFVASYFKCKPTEEFKEKVRDDLIRQEQVRDAQLKTLTGKSR